MRAKTGRPDHDRGVEKRVRRLGPGPWEVGGKDKPSRDLLRAFSLEAVHRIVPQTTETLRREVWSRYMPIRDRIARVGQAGDEKRWAWLNEAIGAEAPGELLALRDGLLEWARPFRLEVAWVLDTALHVLASAHRAEQVRGEQVRAGQTPGLDFWGGPEGPLARTLAVRGLPLLGEEFPLGTLLARRLDLLHDPGAKREMATSWLTQVRDSHDADETPRCLPPFVFRYPGWDPRMSWEIYADKEEKGIRAHFEAALQEYRARMEARGVALGLEETPELRRPEHFDWLVRYQVLGESFGQIARECLPGNTNDGWKTVASAVRRLALAIGLRLRGPAKGGRPRKSQP